MVENKIANLYSFIYLWSGIVSGENLLSHNEEYLSEKYDALIGIKDVNYKEEWKDKLKENELFNSWEERWGKHKEQLPIGVMCFILELIENSGLWISLDQNESIHTLVGTFEKYIGSFSDINSNPPASIHPLILKSVNNIISRGNKKGFYRFLKLKCLIG